MLNAHFWLCLFWLNQAWLVSAWINLAWVSLALAWVGKVRMILLTR